MEATIDRWWASARNDLLSQLSKEAPQIKGYSPPKTSHPIDYRGETVGHYWMEIEQDRQNVTLEPTEPIHTPTLSPLYREIEKAGYQCKTSTTENNITVYMAKRDRWGTILKQAAYTFSRLGDDSHE